MGRKQNYTALKIWVTQRWCRQQQLSGETLGLSSEATFFHDKG
jgi:hypothetical protein